MSADFSVTNHGSIVLVEPTTDAAHKHLLDNTGEEAQWLGRALVVEPRYLSGLAAALADEGFRVAGF